MRSLKITSVRILVIPFFILSFNINNYCQTDISIDKGIPQIVKSGNVKQLFVDGKPFLILGGELNNSSSSSIEYMKAIWQEVTDLNFNTVITPLSWELIEPEEGKFNFELVDSLITEARQHNMHIVFLWLASWKNGMSSYIPLWVKENYKKYTRVKLQNNYTTEILSTFTNANSDADAKGFARLMKHIREIDGVQHTVLMMQIENEVGILGDSRDRSELADKAFTSPVPKELMSYLLSNKVSLVPEIKSLWGQNNFKSSGNWEDIFGKGDSCNEVFMAWYYSRYVNKVAEAGKKEYPIPMYVNAWLNQEGCPRPGLYPSGGPLANVLDIWQAGAPSISILAPDLYVPDYEERCKKFTQRGNPLFMPEMNSGEDGARNIFIAIGKYNAIGVSPFGIDRLGMTALGNEQAKGPKEAALSKSYNILSQLGPYILDKQVKGEMTGFVIDEKNPVITKQMGRFILEISLDDLFGHKSKLGYGIIMTDGTDQFIGAGSGFRVRLSTVTKSDTIVGIGKVDEGVFINNKWIPGRRLNGDEDDQGRAWRFSPRSLNIEKCRVYVYK